MNSAPDHAAEEYPDQPEPDKKRAEPAEPGSEDKTMRSAHASASVVPPLLDTEAGQIGRILFSVPRRGAVYREGPLRRMLEGMPHRAALDLLVAPEAMDKVSGWIDATGPGALACLIQARSGLGFPIWAQDIGIARADGSFGLLGDPEAAGPAETARTLADGAEIKVEATGLRITGGNVIPCGERLLIGADSLTETDLNTRTLGELLDPGRRPVVLGTSKFLPAELTRPTDTPEAGWTETLHWRAGPNGRQPMPRLDLFVTPAGSDDTGTSRFLVGCPKRGAEALGHAHWPHALSEAFDEIAHQLTADGAKVIRNPLPLVWKDDVVRKRRIWFHLPANNVLLEDTGGSSRTVFMPCFEASNWPDLREIDSMNAAIWAWLGYSVVRIPDMLALAQGFGGPRRIAMVLSRT